MKPWTEAKNDNENMKSQKVSYSILKWKLVRPLQALQWTNPPDTLTVYPVGVWL